MGKLKFIVLAALCVMLLSSAAYASSTVTVNPIGILFGIMSAEYETALSPSTTIGIEGLYWKPSLGSDFELSALGLGGGMRKYLRGRAHEGFYLGGYLSYASLTGTYKDDSASVQVIGVSGRAGFKSVYNSGFVLDLGVGIGTPISTSISSGDFSESDVSGALGTSFSIGLGYAW